MSASASLRLISQRLQLLATHIKTLPPSEIYVQEDRHERFSLNLGGLHFDYSLQVINPEILSSLLEYADNVNIQEYFKSQFAGERVNSSEDRAVTHTSNRGTPTSNPNFDQAQLSELNRCKQFANRVLNGSYRSHADQAFTDVVHVGIGGSYLGQKLLCEALPSTHLNIHFLANASTSQWQKVTKDLNPERTLFVVASKSFSTPETIKNYHKLKSWLAETTLNPSAAQKNVVAVTANQDLLANDEQQSFYIEDSVGGRFSLWSTMGLPIMLSAGIEQFDKLLEGAHLADEHVLTSEPASNIGLLLALLQFWNINFLGTQSHALLTYVEELRLLTTHLQQVELESLGKSVDNEGNPLQIHSNTVVWGGEETEGQHAWHQWLHQTTHAFSADVIGSEHCETDQDLWVLANCLAQQELLFFGDTQVGEPHRTLQGRHGSNLILLKSLNAKTIGTLIALYEHKVACLGHLWGVNAFDQWGVEAGKVSADHIHSLLRYSSKVNPKTLRDKRLHKIASHLSIPNDPNHG